MAWAHRSGNSSPPRASRGDRDVRTTCLFCSKGKRCSIAGGHWAGIGMAAAAPSRPAGPPGQGQRQRLTPAFLSQQAQLHRSRAQLPATMLLLLLGILFLHIAVLVLLFVSTIVSVSAGATGQGRLPAGRPRSLCSGFLASASPGCQTGVIFADSWTSQRPQDDCCRASLPPTSFQFFEKVRPASGVESEQGLEEL